MSVDFVLRGYGKFLCKVYFQIIIIIISQYFSLCKALKMLAMIDHVAAVILTRWMAEVFQSHSSQENFLIRELEKNIRKCLRNRGLFILYQ